MLIKKYNSLKTILFKNMLYDGPVPADFVFWKCIYWTIIDEDDVAIITVKILNTTSSKQLETQQNWLA